MNNFVYSFSIHTSFLFYFYCESWNQQKSHSPTHSNASPTGQESLCSGQCWLWHREHCLARDRYQYLPRLVGEPPVLPTQSRTSSLSTQRTPVPAISTLQKCRRALITHVPNSCSRPYHFRKPPWGPSPTRRLIHSPMRRAAHNFFLLVVSVCMGHWTPFTIGRTQGASFQETSTHKVL